MYIGGDTYEFLNGKIRLHTNEIKELLHDMQYYGVIEDVTKDLRTYYEAKIDKLKSQHKLAIKKLKNGD